MILALLLTLASPAQAVINSAAAPRAKLVHEDDLLGDYYAPTTSSDRRKPAILLLGGSEGGLGGGAKRQARALAARGYVVLHLSYFGGPGQPTALKLIPLEKFYRGLDWLKAQPGVDGDRIGVVGTSKGAEAALLVASRRSDVRAVVLGSPSSVVWGGIDGMSGVNESSWTEKGKPVPFTPYGWTGKWEGLLALYTAGLAGADGRRGAIPLERVSGQVTMVCGEKDALWPSCPMAREVAARLRASGRRVTLLAYPDAGHAAFGPPAEPDAPPPSAEAMAMMGGTAAATNAARADAWPRVLEALDAALKPA